MKQYNGCNNMTVKTVGMNSARSFKTRVALRARAKFTELNLRYVELYLRINFRRCLHVEISSLRLFSVAMCGLVIRKNFSVLQRLQRFVRLVYGFAFATIFHVTVYSLLSSFSFHRCLLSSVYVPEWHLVVSVSCFKLVCC